jgi:hypothetical protein
MRIPGMEKIHPLHSQLNLIACRLSGKIWKTKEFQIKLPKSYWLLGEAVRKIINSFHKSDDCRITANCNSFKHNTKG